MPEDSATRQSGRQPQLSQHCAVHHAGHLSRHLSRHYDVLVCGAGPAGSCAAQAAASAGASVLLLERRQVVGVPVRCAEYIPALLAGQLAGQLAMPAADYVVQKTDAMQAYLHGECIQNLPAPGFVIRRDAFDQALAAAAQQAGAVLVTGCTLLGLEDGPGEGHTAMVRSPAGEVLRIRADIVIGADGPHSRVCAHVSTSSWQLLPALQLRLPLATRLSHTRVYFDEALHAGYAWLFPRGREANVGLGVVPAGRQETLWRKLNAFVDFLCEEGLVERPAAARPVLTGGWIPVQERPCVAGTILLAGDAAGHTHPITGAGIAQAVLAGEMAGRWAGCAAASGSLACLHSYAEEWQDLYGDVLAHARSRRLAWQAHTGPLEDVIRSFWIGSREYYAA